MPGSEGLDELTAYVLETTRHVIESFGPRPPGGEGERLAQHFVRDELQPFCDDPVRVEPFRVAQKAFAAVPLIVGLLLLLAIGCYWVWAPLALAASAAAVLIVVFEWGFYRQALDPLFPKRTSLNVVGARKPSTKVAKRLVLNAHTDAAYEWRLLYRFPRAFPLLALYGFAGLVAVFGIDLLTVLLGGTSAGPPGGTQAILGAIQLAFLPGALMWLCFASFRHVSPGANDDLSGVFVVTALARHLGQTGTRLENTELVLLVTGSEEAGLRGAKAFAARHAHEWRDVETVLVTLDTLRDLEHLHVYHRDRSGMVRHDRAVCGLLHDAGRRCGLELGYASVYLGATDAAAFTEAGVRSGALCAMDPRPAHYYHNRRDHFSNMSGPCIRKVIEILLEAIREYDRRGLDRAE